MKILKFISAKQRLFFIATMFTFTVVNAQDKKIIAVKEWSLFGSMTFNNQSVNDAGINAPLNYLYNSVNNNIFKPGFSGGFRYDIKLEEKYNYSLIFGINRVSSGVFYQNKYSLAPFIEDFTHFKADNDFTTLSFASHMKFLLPVNNNNNYKFYVVAGPSLDYKISNISQGNLINGAGNRAFLNGDLGAEFNNKGYYLLYAHYKFGKNISKSPVTLQVSRIELGLALKLKDLF
jgi:hypothetical protein